MKQYYVIENGLPRGPYTPAQLRSMGVEGGASVWEEPSAKWVIAGSIEGFYDDGDATTPSPPPAPRPSAGPEKPEPAAETPAAPKAGARIATTLKMWGVVMMVIVVQTIVLMGSLVVLNLLNTN